MTTPEGKPKNYIVSGISKSLLTPCRRVGLSRKKKTPALNVLTPPETNSTPPNNSSVKKDDEGLDETPRRCLKPKVDKKPLDKVEPKNEAKENLLSHKKKTPLKKVFKPQEAIETTPNDRRKSFSVTEDNVDVEETPKRYLNPDVDKQKLPEISHERLDPKQDKLSPDKTIPTNDEAMQVNFQNKVIKEANTHCDINTQTLEVESDTSEDTNSETDSPSQSPLISRVSVQVHRPIAKRSINFSENISSQESEQSVEEVENSETFNSKTKKRKLRLDSDDFDSVDLVESISEKLKTQSQSDSTKLAIKSSLMSTNGTMLARFTTEEYLKEFSENPKSFGEAMEMGSTNTNNYDDDFAPSIKMKIKKIGSDYSSQLNKPHKKYRAILCSSIMKTKEENDQITSNKQLTVTLERMSNNSSIMKTKEENNQITSNKQLTVTMERMSNNLVSEKLEDIPKNIKPKSVTSKFSLDNNSDDEMFTSSPESDKRRRENLLKLIMEKEKEVQRKEEVLERLHQAQVYKKKHSPSKLNKCSQLWMEGCKRGLKDLLVKMQEHGPMDMNTLLKNLRIPEDIVRKLNLL